MLPQRVIDAAVESLTRRLRVGNEVSIRDGSLHLDTHIAVGNRTVYTHSLDLEPVLEEIQRRITTEDTPNSPS